MEGGHLNPSARTGAHRIERRSIPESIRDSLKERILSGEIGEGEALVQDAIAEEYAVSRMPVREALRQLEAYGLVSMQTHRGAIVRAIPTEQVEELFELRALLEGDLLLRAVPRMTDRDLDAARALFDQLEESFRRGDMADWGRLNWAFHRALYAPSDREQTILILQGINVQVERYIRLHLLITDGTQAAGREHREILRRCALRDAAGAAAYLREHILAAGRNLVLALRTHRAGTISTG